MPLLDAKIAPTQPVGWNDDAQAGVDVGSHALVELPATGTYRVVVSSYDNWQQYPANVTRGDYRVAMRHGVSTLTKGERLTLGIIFHDAE